MAPRPVQPRVRRRFVATAGLLAASALMVVSPVAARGPAPRTIPEERMLEYSTRIAGERTHLLVNWNGKASLTGGGDRDKFSLATERRRSLRRKLRKRHPSGDFRSRDGKLRDLLYRTRRPDEDTDGPLREVPPTVTLTIWPKDSRFGRQSPAVSDRNWRFVKRLDELVRDLRQENPG